MSSNDRQNRSNRQRRAPAPSEPNRDDELHYEDEWDIGNDFEEPYPPQRTARRTTSPQRPAPGTPAIQGTAAQLDRLRRNIRQTGRQSTPQQSRPPSPRQQPPRQPARYTPSRDDLNVEVERYDDDQVYQQPYQPTHRPQQRNSPFPRQPTPPRGDRYDDVAYDTETYSDTGDYDTYDDDFSEYDAPRRPSRTTRSVAPQVRMPSFSRPTLPPAIAKADLVNDAPALGIIGVGLVSLAAMAIFVANRVESLAPQFATHVSASGILENFRSENALWNLALMAAMFTLMGMIMAWFISPIDRFASRFVLVGSLVTQFVAWVALFRIL